jgi:hypothetical protein
MSPSLFSRRMRPPFEKLGLDGLYHSLRFTICLWTVRFCKLLLNPTLHAQLSESSLKLFPVIRIHHLDLERHHDDRFVECYGRRPARLIRKDVGKAPRRESKRMDTVHIEPCPGYWGGMKAFGTTQKPKWCPPGFKVGGCELLGCERTQAADSGGHHPYGPSHHEGQ